MNPFISTAGKPQFKTVYKKLIISRERCLFLVKWQSNVDTIKAEQDMSIDITWSLIRFEYKETVELSRLSQRLHTYIWDAHLHNPKAWIPQNCQSVFNSFTEIDKNSWDNDYTETHEYVIIIIIIVLNARIYIA